MGGGGVEVRGGSSLNQNFHTVSPPPNLLFSFLWKEEVAGDGEAALPFLGEVGWSCT